MTQHQIDLLPADMRAESQARAVASRNLAMAALATGLLILMITHARITRDSAEGRLLKLRAQARHVEENERQAQKLTEQLNKYENFINRYNNLVTPIDISRIVAAAVAEMPESMTLDRFDIQADQIRRARRTRRVGDEEAEPRVLVGEMAGFARDDLDIAEFITQLQEKSPFEQVSLDFSRPRVVRDLPAREFRLSFTINFDASYSVADAASAGGEGAPQP